MERITFDHRNGDKSTGIELMKKSLNGNYCIDTLEKYRTFCFECSITDKMTVSENSKIGNYQKKNPIIFGEHEKRLALNNIELVLEKQCDPYSKKLTQVMEENILIGWDYLAFYRKDYLEAASERRKLIAINRAGRDACKAISTKGIWSGYTSVVALDIIKLL